ncbi:unnamed protein product [Blepharisma stoltei]|uniref:Mitochondrial import receptor subunit TOM22 homolog n=1 Tax=Blepharisma stoltei TaxID=1481888 RepID=A0AAU9KB81_9CILI|nr:unnamed protein product [Blepharisma stoltei]
MSKQGEIVEMRYQKVIRVATESRVGQIILNFWNSWVSYYTSKTLRISKNLLWTLTSVSAILLLPLTIETILETDRQMQNLSSQLDTAGQASFRPY